MQAHLKKYGFHAEIHEVCVARTSEEKLPLPLILSPLGTDISRKQSWGLHASRIFGGVLSKEVTVEEVEAFDEL